MASSSIFTFALTPHAPLPTSRNAPRGRKVRHQRSHPGTYECPGSRGKKQEVIQGELGLRFRG